MEQSEKQQNAGRLLADPNHYGPIDDEVTHLNQKDRFRTLYGFSSNGCSASFKKWASDDQTRKQRKAEEEKRRGLKQLNRYYVDGRCYWVEQ